MDKAQVADDILDYLAAHPDAEDTLEGIVEWWLEGQKIIRQTATVKEALTELGARGLVLQRRGHDGRIFYHINREKLN